MDSSQGVPPAQGPGGGGSAPVRRPAGRGLLWGAAAVVAVGMLLFSAARAGSPRATGGALPGTAPAAASQGTSAGAVASAPDPYEAAAKATLTHDPESVEARLELARVSLDRQDYMAVWRETRRVLARVPGEPRALTYQSQVRLAMGQPEVALTMLEQALTKDPSFLQAYVYLSYVHLRLGHSQEAVAAIAEAKRRFPAEAAVLDRGFADMRAGVEKEGPQAPAGQANPHATLGSPAVGGAANPHAALGPSPAPNPHSQAGR
jgi:tetratricopeptide (TPR) repeat protein